ncbi:Protein kinase-like domain protein [Niveomyces insectorum RCEF 264]|uniref:Protein kinase-like domain protein n=1 Tax=Niveomyces insectorum RCEF 264 TaxID=1081102 RepID=A0A167U6X1_9HYPO|nr:Protein kinase-like domain protein [Niveomyces insectorum RCEF 264]
MTDDNGTACDCPDIAVPGYDKTESDHRTIQPAASGPATRAVKPATALCIDLAQWIVLCCTKLRQTVHRVVFRILQNPFRIASRPHHFLALFLALFSSTRHANVSDRRTSDNNNNKREATPVTPPLGTEHRGSYRCIVDYGGIPFEVIWSGKQQYPNFSEFPSLDTGTISSEMRQSPAMASLWRASTPVGFGSYASTRHDKSRARFPIIKLAHPDDQSRRFLQHEFSILSRLMALPNLAVVQIDPEPILDDGLLCGFRMEELVNVPLPEFVSRKESIKHALQQLHAAGFCHGDVQPSNIMKDKTGRIVLIDFGFSGQIGDDIPSFFPEYMYQNRAFHKEADMASLSKFQAQVKECTPSTNQRNIQ